MGADINYVLASSAETGGRYLAMHVYVPPGGGPPPHTHTREDESFIILDGEITFTVDGRDITAGPGTLVDAPRGTPHRFTNTSAKPANMIVIVTPGDLEGMFNELGIPIEPGKAPAPLTPADVARYLEVCPRYGITLHLAS